MKTYKQQHKAIGMLLWSVALPGFGQLLNGNYIKGIVLIGLELLVNVMGNLNEVIIFSFQGNIDQAIAQTNYAWLMFYPCLYFFGIWDAYKDAGGGQSPYAWLPLVTTAYIVTIGLTYSSVLSIMGVKFGPVWLSILSIPIGLGVGDLIRRGMLRRMI